MDRFIDSMRTRYVRLPPPVKSVLGPALRALPFSWRFGPRYWRFRQDIRRSRHDPEFVRRFQLTAWREVLTRAERTSHFRPLIRAIGGPQFRAADWTIEDLGRFPILRKDDLIDDPISFLSENPAQYDVRFTSGSSGRPPTRLFLERDRNVGEVAFLHEIWSRIGFKLGDSRAVLRDYAGNVPSRENTWRYDATVRELWLSPFFLTEGIMERYLELLKRYRICFLSGIPSAISILARHALGTRWAPPPCLRGVMTASETLFAHQRQLIASAFGVPVVGHYGMSERVATAGELVDDPDTFEVEPLYGIVELVDEGGKPISLPGRRGRMICTALFSKAMALIRYEVGDSATLVRAATYENCSRLRVRDVRSRWAQEFVIGRGGQKISVISLDQENYFGMIREYQYVQFQPGHVVFRAVPCAGTTVHDINRMLDPVRRRVLDELTFGIEIVPALPVGSTGKRHFVDQRIPNVTS
jgi:phenylacetate-coenzyme A ligase PaaK-like adenylate-forming protein